MEQLEREYPDPCERYEQFYRDMIEYERDYDYYLNDFNGDEMEENTDE